MHFHSNANIGHYTIMHTKIKQKKERNNYKCRTNVSQRAHIRLQDIY